MIGKKWYTSVLKIQPYVIMSILVIIAVVFAQDASWESGIKKLNTTAWGYIKVAVQSGLFLWFAIKVVMIFVQRDKETNWWGMLMLPSSNHYSSSSACNISSYYGNCRY